MAIFIILSFVVCATVNIRLKHTGNLTDSDIKKIVCCKLHIVYYTYSNNYLGSVDVPIDNNTYFYLFSFSFAISDI